MAVVNAFRGPGLAGGEPSPALQPRPEPERHGGPERLRRAPPFHAALGVHPRLEEGFGYRTQAHQCAGRVRRGEAFVPGSVLEAPVSRFGRRVQRVEAGGLGPHALAHRLARRGTDGVRRVVGTLAGAKRAELRGSLAEHRPGDAVETFTIFTIEANETMRALQHRTPAILLPEAFEPWHTGEGVRFGSALKYPPAMRWIGRRVKNARNDDPECVLASAPA